MNYQIKFYVLCITGSLLMYAPFTAAQDTSSISQYGFQFLKAKNNPRFELMTGSAKPIIKAGKNSKKIQIRFKIRSSTGAKQMFDANLLSLVVDREKVRVRPVDVEYNYAIGWIFIPFDRIYMNKVAAEDSTQIRMLYGDNGEVIDRFPEFSIDEYSNVSPSLNRGTKRYPVVNCFYLRPVELKNCKLDVYFIVSPELEAGSIYYADRKLVDFVL